MFCVTRVKVHEGVWVYDTTDGTEEFVKTVDIREKIYAKKIPVRGLFIEDGGWRWIAKPMLFDDMLDVKQKLLNSVKVYARNGEIVYLELPDDCVFNPSMVGNRLGACSVYSNRARLTLTSGMDIDEDAFYNYVKGDNFSNCMRLVLRLKELDTYKDKDLLLKIFSLLHYPSYPYETVETTGDKTCERRAFLGAMQNLDIEDSGKRPYFFKEMSAFSYIRTFSMNFKNAEWEKMFLTYFEDAYTYTKKDYRYAIRFKDKRKDDVLQNPNIPLIRYEHIFGMTMENYPVKGNYREPQGYTPLTEANMTPIRKFLETLAYITNGGTSEKIKKSFYDYCNFCLTAPEGKILRY